MLHLQNITKQRNVSRSQVNQVNMNEPNHSSQKYSWFSVVRETQYNKISKIGQYKIIYPEQIKTDQKQIKTENQI